MRLLMCAVLVLLIGCDSAMDLSPETAAADGVATSKVVHEAYSFEGSMEGVEEEITCLGETVTFHGFWEANGWVKTTPSGNEVDHLKLNYDTSEPLWFEGPQSGVWTLMNGEDNSHVLTKPRGTSVVDHFQANEIYAGADGKKVHFKIGLVEITDAEGEASLKRWTYQFKCQ